MKKLLFTCALALLCAIGCQKEIEAPVESIDSSAPSFIATIEKSTPDSKTVLDPAHNVLWMKGDQITIFNHSTAPLKYQIDDADHLRTHGTFRKVANTDGSLIVGTETNALVAFYPYTDAQLICDDAETQMYKIQDYVLPAIQTCIDSETDTDADLMKRVPCQLPMMYAQTDLEDYINFKNVLGILCLNIKGNGSIQKIVFRGNNNEIVCGAGSIYIEQTGVPSISLHETDKKEITLDCGTNGFPLYSEFDQMFMIALAPTVFPNGFTCDIHMMDGKVETVKATGRQEIKRSRILNMPSIEVGNFGISFDNNIVTIDENLTKTVTVTSSKAWQITSSLPTWLSVDKMSYEPFPQTTSTVTLTAEPLSGPERSAEIVFDNGRETSVLTVKQTTDRLLFNDFDVEPATQNYGPASNPVYWPYLNQSFCWNNSNGLAVTPQLFYEGTNVTTRNVYNSDIVGYSSGINHLYFSKGASLIIKGLDVTGNSNVRLEFSGSRFLFDNVNGRDPDSIVTPERFKVYVGVDGEKWVEVTYQQNAAVIASSTWQSLVADLTLPVNTTTLYLAFKNIPTTGEGHRLDDLKLLKSTAQGTVVDFSKAILVDGISPQAPVEGAIFSEDFFNAPKDWTIEDKLLTGNLTYVWKQENRSGKQYMKATGYYKGCYEVESWLFSPVIDLTNRTAAYLSFDQALNFVATGHTSTEHIAVMVGDENGTSWTALTIPSIPAGNSWSFFPAGEIDLSAYAGTRIKLAFVYKSSTASAPTWEVDNVLIMPTKK